MLPPTGCRGKLFIPDNSRRKQHPDVPGWSSQIGDVVLKCLTYTHIRVPIVECSFVLHQLSAAGNVFFLRAGLTRPHDVDGQIVDVYFFQKAFSDFGDPPKTDTSGRRG